MTNHRSHPRLGILTYRFLRHARIQAILAVAVPLAIATPVSHAQTPAEFTAQICNEAGVCAPVDPVTALLIAGVKALGDEINKGTDGFGPNGAVIKAVNTVLGDLQRGNLGPNNDLVKAFETIRKDIINGPGPNNDILKFFNGLGIKLN